MLRRFTFIHSNNSNKCIVPFVVSTSVSYRFYRHSPSSSTSNGNNNSNNNDGNDNNNDNNNNSKNQTEYYYNTNSTLQVSSSPSSSDIFLGLRAKIRAEHVNTRTRLSTLPSTTNNNSNLSTSTLYSTSSSDDASSSSYDQSSSSSSNSGKAKNKKISLLDQINLEEKATAEVAGKGELAFRNALLKLLPSQDKKGTLRNLNLQGRNKALVLFDTSHITVGKHGLDDNKEFKPSLSLVKRNKKSKGTADDALVEKIVSFVELQRVPEYDEGALSPTLSLNGADLAKHLVSNAPVIELMDFLGSFLKSRPWRPFMYGLLTDGRFSTMFRVRNDHVNSTARRYELIWFGLDPKYQCLKWLFNQSLQDLGFEPFHINLRSQKVVLDQTLGFGQFCTAFKVTTAQNEKIVVKHYFDVTKAEHERSVYRALRKVPHTTKLHRVQPSTHSSNPANFVAIGPLGQFFALADSARYSQQTPEEQTHIICKAQLDQLTVALNKMHKAGVTHGDIMETNILWVDDKNAVFNDWSHATVWDKAERNSDEFLHAKIHDNLLLITAIKKLRGADAREWLRANVPVVLKKSNGKKRF